MQTCAKRVCPVNTAGRADSQARQATARLASTAQQAHPSAHQLKPSARLGTSALPDPRLLSSVKMASTPMDLVRLLALTVLLARTARPLYRQASHVTKAATVRERTSRSTARLVPTIPRQAQVPLAPVCLVTQVSLALSQASLPKQRSAILAMSVLEARSLLNLEALARAAECASRESTVLKAQARPPLAQLESTARTTPQALPLPCAREATTVLEALRQRIRRASFVRLGPTVHLGAQLPLLAQWVLSHRAWAPQPSLTVNLARQETLAILLGSVAH